MRSACHPRGFFRAGGGPAWHHLQRWLSDPAYRALHRFDRKLRRLPRCAPATVHFEGRSIRLCDGPSFLSAWDEIFVNRIYDIGPLPPKPRLVDAGANVGLAALYWQRRYGEIRYLGFEPDPEIAAICRANLDTWDVRGTLVQAAVGPRSGVAKFTRDGADGGRLFDGNVSGAPEIAVRVENLRDYLEEPVDLLKIDIEGAEATVLPALGDSLDRVRYLFVEWHSPVMGPSGLAAILSAIEQRGFRVTVQNMIWTEEPFAIHDSGRNRQQLNLYATRI